MTTQLMSQKKPYLQSGFSLIELMIAVAIIGILASIAYPSYTGSVNKGKRAEARAALMNMQQQQERFLTQNNTYKVIALGAADSSFKTWSSADSGQAQSSHLLGARTCQAVGGVDPSIRDCIEVFAQPQSGVHTDLEITEMAIDSQGRRTCTGSNTSRCWK